MGNAHVSTNRRALPDGYSETNGLTHLIDVVAQLHVRAEPRARGLAVEFPRIRRAQNCYSSEKAA